MPAVANADITAILWMYGTAKHTAGRWFRKAFPNARGRLPGIFPSSPRATLLYALRMLSAKPWKPANALMVCAIIIAGFCFITLSAALVLQLTGKTEFDHTSFFFLVFATLSMHGPILLATAGFLRFRRIPWSEAFGFSAPGKGRAVLWGVFAALIFLPIGAATRLASVAFIDWINHVFHFHIEVEKTQTAVVVLSDQQTVAAKIYASAFAIIIAPIAEEILFRGILYPAIKQAGYPRAALWGTAIAFAAIHEDIRIFLPLMILGLILVCLYERNNNLLAPIAAHSLFNAINVIFLYFAEDIGNFVYRLFHHQS